MMMMLMTILMMAVGGRDSVTEMVERWLIMLMIYF